MDESSPPSSSSSASPSISSPSPSSSSSSDTGNLPSLIPSKDNNISPEPRDSNSLPFLPQSDPVKFLRVVLLPEALRGLKANIYPGLVLQFFAILIVVLFYTSSGVQNAFNAIANVKQSWSFGFSFLINFFAGGFFPGMFILCSEYYKGVNFKTRRPQIHWEILFLSLFWGYKGVEVDAFYRLQSLMFGDGNSFVNIFPKVLVDQFIYNPLWGVWSVTVPYTWKDGNFVWSTFIKNIRNPYFYYIQTPSTLLSTWFVWCPSVSCIYALPSTCQIPLFAIVLCFWSIVLAVSQKKKSDGGENEQKVKDEIQKHDEETGILSRNLEGVQNELAIKTRMKEKEMENKGNIEKEKEKNEMERKKEEQDDGNGNDNGV